MVLTTKIKKTSILTRSVGRPKKVKEIESEIKAESEIKNEVQSEVKTESKLQLILEVNGTKHEAFGNNLEEAIKSLNLNYMELATPGLFTVIKNDKKWEHYAPLWVLRKILQSDFYRAGMVARVEEFFNLK